MNKYNKLCLSCKKDCKQYVFAMVIECPKYEYSGTPYKNKKDPTKDLTPMEKRKIKNLVCQCANYFKEYNICLPLDTACYMLNKATLSSGICKYFKNAVLPLDSEIEQLLTYGTSSLKTCVVCKSSFPVSGSQKYCSDSCKKIGTRSTEKIYKRNQRRNRG